jgi:2-oxo-4-hydroxy-4-carboxy-5-ureidoimidazoline decarboxylase
VFVAVDRLAHCHAGRFTQPAPGQSRPTAYDRRVTGDVALAEFNAQPFDAVAERLLTACASRSWAATVADKRPYADRDQLRLVADRAVRALDWPEVGVALAAHPRIGQRPTAAGAEAEWSRQEQAGMSGASDDVRAALAEANRAYEERFGHVLLICATGRTDTELLAAARERLANDEITEQGVVRSELARIVALRLDKVLDR